MNSVGATPSASVLAAFGLDGPGERLPGGEGRSVRVGDVVLKPAADDATAAWTAGVMERLAGSPGFRVPEPIRSRAGDFVVDGWTASRFVPGEPGPEGHWDDLLAAGRALHAALRGLDRPGLIDTRHDPWAVADRMAWGETTVLAPESVEPVLRRLRGALVPVQADAQLVHGDLTGNVMFAPGQVPVIIDFSPYWRPAGYANAIVAADGLLYHDAGRALVEQAVPGAIGTQMLLRALIFRLVSFVLLTGGRGEGAASELGRFEQVAELAAGFAR